MTSQKAVLILIPARYHSQRLPGKPLLALAGRSLIEWVAQTGREVQKLLMDRGFKAEYAVVTDHGDIELHCQQKGISCVRVDDEVPSGSERIRLAYQRYFSDSLWDFILNFQGDEPLLKAPDLVSLVLAHLKQEDCEMMTLVHRVTGKSESYTNPNRVKVAFSEQTKQCLYFSRSPIPYRREDQEGSFDYYLHIGVYCYRTKSLERFCEAPPSPLEERERLEQLRALEMGMKIMAELIEDEPRGVDTPEDAKLVEGVLRGQ